MPDFERKIELSNRMKELDKERLLVKQQLDRGRLTEITSNLVETLTSPQMVERMREFREKAEKGASLAEAGEILSVEGLRAAGASLPDDFRLTSRVFEDFETGMRIDIRPPAKGIPDIDPLGWGACAGGGAATVCGCAGGSTN